MTDDLAVRLAEVEDAMIIHQTAIALMAERVDELERRMAIHAEGCWMDES